MNTTPIKFMAWDKNTNELIKFSMDEIQSNFGYDYSVPDNLQPLYDYDFDPVEFMQLTAIRSINDEHIYNHHIVKNENGIHYIVDMFDYSKMYFLSGMALEIVGNRFQHPELLELCK